MKSSSRILFPLMIVAIVVVTGFQLYWLRNNYAEEEDLLQVKTGMSFKQTVFNMQAEKLRKDLWIKDTLKRPSITIRDGQQKQTVYMSVSDEVSGLVNVMREKHADSVRRVEGHMETFVFRAEETPRIATIRVDSLKTNTLSLRKSEKGDKFIQLIKEIESVRDTLRVPEIQKATAKKFLKEGVDVPFTVVKLDSARSEEFPPPMDVVTVGFNNPVSYKLVLGNTAPFLFGKILSPILFSIFLVTVTLVSFLLMYRSLKQQERLAKLKNDFISNVTHELKTPIATVNVALEALKNFNAINDPQKTSEYLDISQQELQRLSLLVDKVLRVSMFESKTVELKPEMFNLEQMISQVAASMRLQFEKLKARVHIESEGGDVNVNADKLHIMSVVYNLFDNALKYSRDNPSINVLIRDKGDALELKFSDNGIGVPDEYKQKIFDKFFRVPNGDVHNVKGYGLGLSYVAHIIAEHKGRINVESTKGEGTSFIIHLPKNYA